MSEWDYNRGYKGKEWGANYTKDNTTGLWMISESDPFKVPPLTEEEVEKGPYLDKKFYRNFYSSNNFVKDETTNLMMALTTEETCEANNSFFCKVRLDAGDVIIMMMMMVIMMAIAR